jgi:hypothetical protein
MTSTQISFQDARLDQTTAGALDAWISIGPDALSLLAVDDRAVVHAAVYLPVHSEDMRSPASVAGLVQSNFLFSLSYRRRLGCLFNTAFTLVPTRLFQSDAPEAYFQLLTPDSGASMGYENLVHYAATAVYGFSEQEIAIWKLMGLAHQPVHAMSVLLHLAYPLCATTPKAVVMHVRGTTAQFAFLTAGRLLYGHAEDFYTQEDLVYHLRMLYAEFDFPADQAPLFVSGAIQPALAALLTTYLGRVQHTPVEAAFRFPTLQTPIPAAHFVEAMAMGQYI